MRASAELVQELAEALRLLLDGPDPHGADAERIARDALAKVASGKEEK